MLVEPQQKMEIHKLSLKYADIIYIKNFYSSNEADTIYNDLIANINWDKKEMEGRQTALYGTAREYKYALNTGIPIHWHQIPSLTNISKKVSEYVNTQFDVCLANYYADGREKFNFHTDKEEIGKESPICSLSFGAERKFYFRSKHNNLPNKDNTIIEEECVILEHGSLLIIPSICHTYYLHGLPRDNKIKTPRINLTFRKTNLET